MNNKQTKKSPPVSPQTQFVKILHGLIIVSLFIMIGSGLQIYNANPVFGGRSGWKIPHELILPTGNEASDIHIPLFLTLGGWLGGGRNWHFTTMWVFAFTLLIYGIYIFLTQRWKRKFVSEQDLKALKVGQNPKRRTYAWHRLIYTGIIPVLILAIFSGLAMYKPAQLHWLSGLFINWQILRTVHFLTVPISLLFVLVHIILGIRAGGLRLTRSMFQP
jgi:thiosulfate reductase cytochrome b subunit